MDKKNRLTCLLLVLSWRAHIIIFLLNLLCWEVCSHGFFCLIVTSAPCPAAGALDVIDLQESSSLSGVLIKFSK